MWTQQSDTHTVPSELPVMGKRNWIKLAPGDFDPNAQKKKTFHHRLKR